MKIQKITISIILLLMTITWSCKDLPKAEKEGAVDYLNESKEDFNQRMKWWREARFGMFIHWGIYAIPAGIHKEEKIKGVGEWIQLTGQIPIADYEKYAKQFNPVDYNAEE